jgi:hypothetical protein
MRLLITILLLTTLTGCLLSTGFVVLAQDVGPPAPPPKIMQPKERPYGQIFQMMKPMSCNDTKVIKDFIKGSANEDPLAYGLNYNYMGYPNVLTTLYINPQMQTFSIVEHAANGLSCILGQGLAFQILDESLLDGKPF